MNKKRNSIKLFEKELLKVRLSEAEYQLMDSNNPYGSIAKLLRQSAIDEVVKIHNSKAEESEKLKPLKVVKTSYSSTESVAIRISKDW